MLLLHSSVYVLYLDASKAFDCLCHAELLQLSLKRNLCPLVIRFLYKLYTQSKMKVRWNRDLSSLFPVKCGVKQGGVASPLFFNIYVDELYDLLIQSGMDVS